MRRYVGERIKKLREAQEMTLAQVCKLTGIEAARSVGLRGGHGGSRHRRGDPTVARSRVEGGGIAAWRRNRLGTSDDLPLRRIVRWRRRAIRNRLLL